MSVPLEDEGFWYDHVAAWRDSGLRRPAYCTAHGLALRRFNAWEQYLRPRFRRAEKTPPGEKPGFVPMVVDEPALAPSSLLDSVRPAPIEVLVAGLTVRVPVGVCEATLRRVLVVARGLA